MNRSALRVVVVVLVVLLVLAGSAGGFVWWKISGLKGTLVRGLGNALGARVEIVSPVDLDIWNGEMRATDIKLTNLRPTAPWKEGSISQAAVRFHLMDLLGSTLPVTVEVNSWNLVLHPVSSLIISAGTTPEATGAAMAAPEPPPAKSRIQVTQMTVHDGAVKIELANNREIDMDGIDFTATDNGNGVWTTDLKALSLKSGEFEAGATSVLIHGDKEKATFSSLRMVCGQGLIAGDGELDLGGDHKARVSLQGTDIPVNMLVGVQWQMKLSGLVTGQLDYDGNEITGSATGNVAMKQAKINVFPWLGKLTALVGLPDITNVELDKATSDFQWKDDHTIHLTNVDVRKNGITRLSGAVDIDATGQVDGKLKLGLPASVISKWPQLQTKVFPEQLDDFSWAEVHVTGPADHLQEDLTSRVLGVGLDQGTGIIDDATKKATDFLKGLLGP